jgi:hypothetical protein
LESAIVLTTPRTHTQCVSLLSNRGMDHRVKLGGDEVWEAWRLLFSSLPGFDPAILMTKGSRMRD